MLLQTIRTTLASADAGREIGRLQRVPLREVWRHEALGFTTWLERNLDVLNDALDITLSSAERDQSAAALFFV